MSGASGTFSYAPAKDYWGSDGFLVIAADPTGLEAEASVTIPVTEVNDPPNAVNDRRTTTEDAVVTLNAKGNDLPGPENEGTQTLAVVTVTDPAHGTAVLITDPADPDVGKIRYRPDPNYNNTDTTRDTFAYVVCDNGTTGRLADPRCDDATVAVLVTAIDDAPACPDRIETPPENVMLTVPDVCTEVDGDAMTTPSVVTPPSHGSAAITAGSAAYTPAAGFNGSDPFVVQACDTGTAASLCDTATVRVTVVRTVSATVETKPVPHAGDAADDPAVWVDPVDPAKSAIIGADKRGGLAVYDLDGNELQYLADGEMNNVDLRYDHTGSGRAIVTAGARDTRRIAIYRMDPTTRTLDDAAYRAISTEFEPYGSCMYRSATNGKLYVFVTSKNGDVAQWELVSREEKVDATLARSFDVGGQAEGCVADDELGHFYVGEENVGIWKYGAEPSAGVTRTAVDSTAASAHLVADVEGHTIAYGAGGTGYLVASSQGNSTYAVYRREAANAFVRSVRIVGAGDIDGTEDTDGIDVTTASLGPAFPNSAFVAQDGANGADNQNFKIVPLERLL